MPGFGGPAMGGGKGKGKGKKGKKKGGKSGNPMKREAEEKALRDKLAGKNSDGRSSGGSAFAKKPQNPALPAGLQDLMGDAPVSCRRTLAADCPACALKQATRKR